MPQDSKSLSIFLLSGQYISVDDVIAVVRYGHEVVITSSQAILSRVSTARAFVDDAVEKGEAIYGVTTGFGGMSNVAIPREEACALQTNMLWYHRTGAGNVLPLEHVRAAMLLRANSLLQGSSGIRLEIIHRFVQFLNHHITPIVRELGSIGASGDLVPLASIAGCIIGAHENFQVDFNGKRMSALTALERIGLKPICLLPKEGLAMVNGTSVMTGVAVCCVAETRNLFALAMGAHALFAQALRADNESYHPFTHSLKPHLGQKWAADIMLALLDNSRLSRDEHDRKNHDRNGNLIQDRYSLRCLPQYIGPIYDGFQDILHQMEVEASSVSDNPLIDTENARTYHGGNFLGQYVGVGMDRLRYYLSLIAKHLDAQIALLVAPEFNNGLPPSLVGNSDRHYNMGLKGLQISANSMLPLLEVYGHSIADRFPTHAEQFNQNINSQGFNSANLARQAVDVMRHYISAALLFGVQAADLRTKQVYGHYDASEVLSTATAKLYCAVLEVIGKTATKERPYVWNDDEQFLDVHQEQVANNIASGGIISKAIAFVMMMRPTQEPNR
ncbi:Phenylalanine ammonia-lyase [Gracilaria domingensis]|nr:Phenylalanine ammonia-lyase [Gracilaria domingensis]